MYYREKMHIRGSEITYKQELLQELAHENLALLGRLFPLEELKSNPFYRELLKGIGADVALSNRAADNATVISRWNYNQTLHSMLLNGITQTPYTAHTDVAEYLNLLALCRDTADSTYDANKVAYLLGGQSGSGKSVISKFVNQEGSFAVINADNYRSGHPNYLSLSAYDEDGLKETSRFAGAVTQELIERYSDAGTNLIVEGTLRTAETPRKTATLLRTKGYDVRLAVMAIRKEVSYLSTLERYFTDAEKGMGRPVPKAHHDLIVDSLLTNLKELSDEGLFTSVLLYNRDEKLYQGTATDALLHAYTAEIERPFTSVERERLSGSADFILQKLEALPTDTSIADVPVVEILKEVRRIRESCLG